jgi:hypothetical protein
MRGLSSNSSDTAEAGLRAPLRRSAVVESPDGARVTLLTRLVLDGPFDADTRVEPVEELGALGMLPP